MSIAKAHNLDSQLSKHNFCLNGREITCLSLHHLLINSPLRSGSDDDFVSFAKTGMKEEHCEEAENRKRDQSNSLWWRQLRYGRITASIVCEASNKTCTNYGLMIESCKLHNPAAIATQSSINGIKLLLTQA